MENLLLWEVAFLFQHLFLIDNQELQRLKNLFAYDCEPPKGPSQKGTCMRFFSVPTISPQMSLEPVASYPDSSPCLLYTSDAADEHRDV